MKTHNQWICWRADVQPDGRTTKRPCDPRTGRVHDANDPSIWTTFDAARAAAERHKLSGIGFVFTEADPFFFLDIDHSIDPDGTLSPLAHECMAALPCMWERSQSGRGLHAFGTGSPPPNTGNRNDAIGLELYTSKRFVAYTGDLLPGTGSPDVDCSEGLAIIAGKYLPHRTPVDTEAPAGPRPEWAGPEDDDELLARAFAARPSVDVALGEKASFKQLYTADPEALARAFPSVDGSRAWDESRADAALFAHLSWWTGGDVDRMIRIAMTSALVRPKWDRPDYLVRTATHAAGQITSCYTGPAITMDDTADGGGSYSLTDEGNARRIRDRFSGQAIYIPGDGWLLWDGLRWCPDPEDLGMRRHAAEAAEDILKGTGDGRLAARGRWWARSLSAAGISSALTVARGLMRVDGSRMDADPDTLCTPGGVVNLRTGTVRPAVPTDYVSRMTAVPFIPDAPAPEWAHFLETVVPDASLRRYLQVVAGYCLTGHTTMRACYFLLGPGRNGKSTFGEILRGILGEWAGTAPDGFLNHRPGEDRARSVVALHRKRLVLVSELEEGSAFDEPFLKRITGNDTLSGRLLYREGFDFRPESKLMIYANHRPRIRGMDVGIWDRMRIIPFEMEIPASQVDRDLPRRLMAEGPGILRWAVDGAVEWYRASRMPACAQVDGAVDAYREAEDTVRQWFESCVVNSPGAMITSGDLYRHFREWCAQRGERRPPTSQSFAHRLSALGVESSHTRAGGVRLDIAIRDPYEAATLPLN